MALICQSKTSLETCYVWIGRKADDHRGADWNRHDVLNAYGFHPLKNLALNHTEFSFQEGMTKHVFEY